ncbi:hypothetical protein [Paenibacillus ginsengarvi]|uniref:Uncharacterized protein n=1 Tax=Paenibacillus ginsengarvi TaxID=400777 RepID=A0A3B0CLN3_9BACL|nr:hypothetical protein [Paenibacillus ginsengarvi]RKN85648.1 hypothetical protein D7M11_08200 [Paenibacillus ginsengarvi]
MVEKRVILDIYDIIQQVAIDSSKTSDFFASKVVDVYTKPLSNTSENPTVPGDTEKTPYDG